MTSEHEQHDPFARLRDADPAAEPVALPSIAPLLERLDAIGTESARPTPPRAGRPASSPGNPRAAATGRAARGGRRRGQLGAILAVTVMVLAAALGAVGLVGRGPGGLDVVARARAALATNGEILHVATRYEQHLRRGGRPDRALGGGHRRVSRVVIRGERWSVDDPLRFRIRRQVVEGFTDAEAAPVYEEDYAGRRFRSTSPENGELRVAVVPGRLASVLAEHRLTVSAMTGSGPLGSDPVRTIERMLDNGLVEAAGERELGGRRLLRLVYRPRPGDGAHGTFMRGTADGTFAGASFPIEYLVDATTYEPVRIRYDDGPARRGRGGRNAADGSVGTTITFEAYERLPLTPENERLLRIDPSGLRVVRDGSMVAGDARRRPARSTDGRR